jgi:arsenical pump membrane protein
MFLTGMMVLAELARQEGFFDWIAALASTQAKGSPKRLFLLVYAVGTLVTIFLSNDATAVVLTPAVYAATRKAKVSNPLPYLLICAFIANAASFVLPISNPANLVVFGGGHMPPLADWLEIFGLPAVVSIVATYICLRFTQRSALNAESEISKADLPSLSLGGQIAGWSILGTALVLMDASILNFDLGLPTLASAVVAVAVTFTLTRESPLRIVRDISWGVLPLVAGLFVLVEALDRTGLANILSGNLTKAAALGSTGGVALSGAIVSVVTNLANNLPVGLLAGNAIQQSHVSQTLSGAVLIGVDLGPNLSVTGSLATILWLTALRREGQSVTAWQFLKLGIVVMFPPLLLSLAALAIAGQN